MPRRDSVTQALVEQHLRELQKLTDELFKGLFQGHVTSGVTLSNPALIARKLVETDRQLQISVANLADQQRFHECVASMREEIEAKQQHLATCVQDLVRVEQSLQSSLAPHIRSPHPTTEAAHGSSRFRHTCEAEGAPLAVDVASLMSFAHRISYGMSAPPGFQMAASLAPWQSPAPQRHSIIERSTLHRSGARGTVDAAAAGVDCGDVPVAAPLMLMHLPVPAVHHTSVARTACSSASAEVRSLPPPVSMETAVRSVPSTQRLAEVATDDQHVGATGAGVAAAVEGESKRRRADFADLVRLPDNWRPGMPLDLPPMPEGWSVGDASSVDSSGGRSAKRSRPA